MRRLFAALFLLTAPMVLPAQSIYQQMPSDDIWVYPNASDPGFDPVLRVWGDGTHSFSTAPSSGDWSYDYLKWNLSSLPAIGTGHYYQVLEARLTLNSQRASSYTRALAEAHPLEARSLQPTFSELTWTFGDPNNPLPGDPLFGTADLSGYSATAAFSLPIDLLAGQGDFETYFNAGVVQGEMALALTSSMPAVQQGGAFYRLYSKDDPGGRGPSLRVRYRPASVVMGTVLLEDHPAQDVEITFEFRPVGGGIAQTQKARLNAEGRFTLRGVPLQAFQVAVRGEKWLRRIVALDTRFSPVPALNVSLPGGDANGDNFVDALDLAELISAFNTAQGYALFDPAVDFNGDTNADALDLAILINNFNTEGDP